MHTACTQARACRAHMTGMRTRAAGMRACTCGHAHDGHAHRQTDTQADRRAQARADTRTDRHAGMAHLRRRTGGQADRRTGGHAGRRAGGQADKHRGSSLFSGSRQQMDVYRVEWTAEPGEGYSYNGPKLAL